MKNFNALGLVVFLLLLRIINVTAQTDEAIKQKIESLNREMAKAMVEGNYSNSLNFYAPDAISMPNNSQMLKGIEAIKESGEFVMQSGVKFKSFETQTLQVNPCGNQITEIGTYKMIMVIPGMPSDYIDNGKYLTIWEKQPDGSLKIKVEIWNTDVNPMEGVM